MSSFMDLADRIAARPVSVRMGQVNGIAGGALVVGGLGPDVRIGDLVEISMTGRAPLGGEVIALEPGRARVLAFEDCEGVRIGAATRLDRFTGIRPDERWVGRIVDAFGRALDGAGLPTGDHVVPIKSPPPPAAMRRALGPRMRTGIGAIDTMLPLARGQRIGVFAGSGIGKSTLLAEFARGANADHVVLALIGERGRELRHFTDEVLGPEGMARAVVVAATSDQSPLIKRRAGWTAMAVAEHFRDQGKHVLFIADSITRMAEAHREVALSAGEAPSLRAFPPSTAGLISGFAERAGPGAEGQGDITAIFSVLVSGSDMDEPVADMTRGVLDGHVVLERAIAERGRFPAIDVRRSVSRSLPDVASTEENEVIGRARHLLGLYEAAAPMIQAGLYAPGNDAQLDLAVKIWPALDKFFSTTQWSTPETAFAALRAALAPALPE